MKDNDAGNHYAEPVDEEPYNPNIVFDILFQ